MDCHWRRRIYGRYFDHLIAEIRVNC